MTNLAKLRCFKELVHKLGGQYTKDADNMYYDCSGGDSSEDTSDFVYPNDTSLNCYSWLERTFPFNEHCFFDTRV